MQLDLDRLHKAHFTPRVSRTGQTTYVADSVLRLIQLDCKKILIVTSNSVRPAKHTKEAVLNYLQDQKEVQLHIVSNPHQHYIVALLAGSESFYKKVTIQFLTVGQLTGRLRVPQWLDNTYDAVVEDLSLVR